MANPILTAFERYVFDVHYLLSLRREDTRQEFKRAQRRLVKKGYLKVEILPDGSRLCRKDESHAPVP